MEDAYRGTSVDQMVDFAKAMFRYWTQDAFASQFRKLLTLEQFRSAEMGALYRQYLVSGPIGYMADLLTAQEYPQPEQEAAAFSIVIANALENAIQAVRPLPEA